jgi:hypothetical protein
MRYLVYSLWLCRFHAINNGLRNSVQMSFRHLKHATKSLQTTLEQTDTNLAAVEAATIADPISSPP